ncbi:hypothetical protein [Moraxella lacunata]|uniref:hypothetical protein n=1 Tax=Moraxella lacunata TaxID=477 RepID=UPI003EE2B66C
MRSSLTATGRCDAIIMPSSVMMAEASISVELACNSSRMLLNLAISSIYLYPTIVAYDILETDIETKIQMP